MNTRGRLPLLAMLVAVLWLPSAHLPAASPKVAELDCLIEPNTMVTVSSPVPGIVEKVAVDRGDLVKKGQVLAVLESSVEKAEVAVARAKAELEAGLKSGQARTNYTKRKHTRAEELFKKENLSATLLDEAEADYLLAESSLLEAVETKRLAALELERATAALALRTIRSPVTGVVVERLVAPGEFRNPAAHTIVKLAEIDPLRVEVFAPVSLLGKITVDMRARVIPEPPLDQPRTARVSVVDRVVNAASGTFGVRLTLPNPGYRLPAGLKCKVQFTLN